MPQQRHKMNILEANELIGADIEKLSTTNSMDELETRIYPLGWKKTKMHLHGDLGGTVHHAEVYTKNDCLLYAQQVREGYIFKTAAITLMSPLGSFHCGRPE